MMEHSPAPADPPAPASPFRASSVLSSCFAAAFARKEGHTSFAVRVSSHSEGFFTQEGLPAMTLTLQPMPSGADFQTHAVTDEDLLELALTAFHDGTPLIAQGHFESTRRGTPLFHLQDLRDAILATERIQASPAEVAAARQLIQEHSATPDGLFQFLLGSSYRRQEAVTGDRSERMQKAERATALQALSTGQVSESVNPRISLVLTSRPGVGKKILGRLSLDLALFGQTAQSSMMSVAGMGACIQNRRGAFVSTRGVLPTNSGGTVVIEDLHRIPQNIIRNIQALLMGVAEDGRTIASKAANVEYTAETALHINTNQQSVVSATLRAPGVSGKIKELKLPFDLLSRMDIIIELTGGDNAVKQALKMVVQQSRRPTLQQRREREQEARMMKVVVACLLDDFAEVDLGPAAADLEQLMADIGLCIGHFSARMSEEQQQLFDAEGLIRRMANSIKKIASANARLSARGHCTREDVDVAWDMLSYKLEVVRWICDDRAQRVRTLRSREEVVTQAKVAAETRWGEILSGFGGREVALTEIAAALLVNVRTVGRDLENHGSYAEWGMCRVPTVAEDAARALALSRGEEAEAPPEDYGEEHYHATEEPEERGEGKGAEREPGPALLLEPPPADLLPVLVAMKGEGVLRERSEDLAKKLVKAAVAWEPGELGSRITVELLRALLLQTLPDTARSWELACGLQARLLAPDEVVRGRMLLQLVAYAGWEICPEQVKELLSGPSVPAALRVPLGSMLARQEYTDEERWQAALRREAQERERMKDLSLATR